MKTKNIEFAKKSLIGLSIGDAFGDSFFYGIECETGKFNNPIVKRIIPNETKWEFTDDTVMAIAVYNNLLKNGCIDRDELALQFADNYRKDMNRGYGGTAHKILREIGEGRYWKDASSEVFDGQGSMGNGAAMRVAPLGAYFYDNIPQLKLEVKKSAEVTHYNHEAQVGAVAIAYAAARALQLKMKNLSIMPNDFIHQVYDQLEDSDTKAKIGKSMHVLTTYRIDTVVTILGNGAKLQAQDTVPIALWCAAHYLNNFEEALWKAVSVRGDMDTIAAMVGGIVSLYADNDTIPEEWRNKVEKVEDSVFA